MKRTNYLKAITIKAILISALLLITPIAPSEQTAWDCPGCGRKGNTGNFCGGCGHSAPWLESNVAASPETDFEYEIEDGKATITKYIGTGGDVKIPDTLGGNSVRSIGNFAFLGCDSLTSVTIPDSVTSIGYAAFTLCSSLTNINASSGNSNYFSVNGILYNKNKTELICCPSGYHGSFSIPSSVTNIGDLAFGACSSLTSVTIPNSVTSIGYTAFSACSSLKSVTIPDSVISIGPGAFNLCSSLTNINVSSGNKNYYSVNGILYNNNKTELVCCPSGYHGSFSIPSSITNIGDAAFRSCSNLTSVAIPDSVTNIGDEAFYGCSRLTSLTIPNSVTSIGEFAFQDCSSLTSITLSNSLTNINRQAIAQCRNLKSIIIPNGIISISEGAFWECSSLTSVTIPNSVTSIGQDAFQDCSKNLIIYVSKASYALDYCKKQGIKYQIQ